MLGTLQQTLRDLSSVCLVKIMATKWYLNILTHVRKEIYVGIPESNIDIRYIQDTNPVSKYIQYHNLE